MSFDFKNAIDRAGTDSVKWDHYDMKGEVEGMIPMSIADMDFRAPGFIVDAIIERASHGIFGYTVVPNAYYDAIAGWLLRRSGWEVKKDSIRFSPGVIPALNFAVQAFTAPGDKVIIQPPVYHPFRAVVANNGRAVLNNRLLSGNGGYRMDIEGLKKSIDGRTKMIILSNPHNPVGRVWTAEELMELGEVCLENGITIVSDEIHSDLIMPGHRHIPTASLSKELASITVTCTSPSKTFNLAELHVANIVIPDPGLFARFDAALARAGINKPNILGMAASTAAYMKGDAWVDELVTFLHGNYSFMAERFAQRLPALKVSQMEGTYLGWLDFRAFNRTDEELQNILLTKARVAMTPGNIFGPGGEGFSRMNLACPRPLVAEAVDRISAAFS